MPRNISKTPTELELEILQVLWDEGPMPGQTIRNQLEEKRSLTYQSVMTVLGIMEDKGYVSRKKTGARYQYRAKVTRDATTRRVLKDLVKRVFGGSAQAAVIGLLDASDLSKDELRQLQQEIKRNQNGE